MTIFNRKTLWLLLVGDVVMFVSSLWLSLFLRYWDIPSKEDFYAHLAPFSFLFLVWLLIFFISGLYDKQSILFKSRLLNTIIQAEIVNILIAISFFYFIPWYGISPKTTLFLYLIISLFLILVWRMYGYHLFVPKTREASLIVGSGEETVELMKAVNDNPNYNLFVVSLIDLDKEIKTNFDTKNISVIVLDFYNENIKEILPNLYNLIFSGIRFINMHKVYEDVFDRVPLSLVKYNWFIENISNSPKFIYDVLKRIMDMVVALLLGTISLIIYPFVALAIKIQDGGPVFIFQERIGKGNKVIRITKFRSMSVASQDENGVSKPQSITKIGIFIRKTRIDELPQLWNVVMGSLSLIGPRPELPQFVEVYKQEIPFYNIRHLIKPGLSGWAQLYHTTPPKFAMSKEDTKIKLSYDLYYIKNRSFLLDLNIALKTIKELISRKGV